MSLPKQVEAQAAQVEAFFQQQTKNAAPEQVELEQSATVERTDNPDQAEPLDSATTVETSQSEPVTNDLATQIEQLRKELEKSEQRYRTLNGMIKKKDEEIRNLQALIASINQAPQQPQNDSAESSKPKYALTPEDESLFGEDLVGMVRRAIDTAMSDVNSRLSKLEQVVKQAESFATMSMRERFEAELTKAVPQWREIDTSEEFREWLQQSPSRLAVVGQAMQNLDVVAIADIFKQYIALHSSQSVVQPSQNAEAMRKRIAPGKGRASNPVEPPAKKIWTRSEIAEVYRNRRAYPSEKFSELEKEIFAAQRENRVDYTR